MDKTIRNKWQVRLAALIIFLLGFVAGALALNGYYSWRRGARAQTSRQDRFEQMLDRLQLGAEQKAQVQQILGDAREELGALRRESEPRVDEIRQHADARLQQVLTPEQWQQFRQLRDEMRGPRRRGRGARSEGPQRPGSE